MTRHDRGMAVPPQGDNAPADVPERRVRCFLPNTLIATPRGQLPVQSLRAGDMVRTARGQMRPITWIGTGRAQLTRGQREAATPVVVRKDAIAPNVPHRDLFITKDHALLLNNVLIPVEALVNNRSVIWDDRTQEVTLFHLELETHDVLIANGAPAESYRDDGNHTLYHNANPAWAQAPRPSFAPVVASGPAVDVVRRVLATRAGGGAPAPVAVTVTDDPDLHVLVDGERIEGIPYRESIVFTLRAPPAVEARIISRASAPSDLGISGDSRALGVAIRRIGVFKGPRGAMMEAEDPALDVGFHPYEAEPGVRWTTGNALVPKALFDHYDSGPLKLTLYLGGTTKYAVPEGSGGG